MAMTRKMALAITTSTSEKPATLKPTPWRELLGTIAAFPAHSAAPGAAGGRGSRASWCLPLGEQWGCHSRRGPGETPQAQSLERLRLRGGERRELPGGTAVRYFR